MILCGFAMSVLIFLFSSVSEVAIVSAWGPRVISSGVSPATASQAEQQLLKPWLPRVKGSSLLKPWLPGEMGSSLLKPWLPGEI